MAFFDQIVNQLFPQKSNKNEILLHEPIKRSKSYLDDYTMWTKSFKRFDILNAVYNSYELKKQGVIGDPDVHLLETNRSNGFAISYNERMNKEEFVFLFDWFGERTKELNYKRANSDVTVTAKNGIIETLSRYYFKPGVNFAQPKDRINQQYGNILIEHITVDDHPTYIRFIVNNYNDRQYNEADDFEKLAEFLLNK